MSVQTQARPDETRQTWTVARTLKWMQQRFAETGSDSARLDAELLLAEVLGCNRLGVITRAEQPLNERERDQLRELVRRRQQSEPVAYILGRKGFRDFDLHVGPGVLVPRPETEFVVDAALDMAGDGVIPQGNIVDFGTGSGAIAIALKRAWPERHVIALEKSEVAAAFARRNLDALAPEVDLHIGDWADADATNIALAVTNPPYVPETDRKKLAPDLGHEPDAALFAGHDGLDAIRRLATLLPNMLTARGAWICEAGAGQQAAIDALLAETGWQPAAWTTDFSGIARVFTTWRVQP